MSSFMSSVESAISETSYFSFNFDFWVACYLFYESAFVEILASSSIADVWSILRLSDVWTRVLSCFDYNLANDLLICIL